MIDKINEQYDRQGLAIVTKIPTPIKVLKIKLGKIVEAFFEKKSTVDYNGMVQGYGICFDAKETDKDYLPLNNIHQHQIDYMNKYKSQKGYSFIICHFKAHKRFYLIPLELINHYLDNAKKGGRKSIPIEALDKRYIIPSQNGLPNYLVALNYYIDDCIKKEKSA